nr:hypothetical protein [Tanacetum cinerariifolium]
MRKVLTSFVLSYSSAHLSSSKLARDQTSNPTSSANPTPKGQIRRSSKQKVENSHSEEHLTPVATMTDNRTMAEMLRAPTEGFTELHQLDTFYNALNPSDQDSLNAAVGGNLLEKSPQDALTIIENKLKVRNSRTKSIASPVNACDNHSSSELAKLTHAVNQQTSAVITAMTAMLKQLQSNPPPAQVKAVEEICVTCGGAHPYYQCLAAGGNTFPEFWDNIQGYVSAAAGNYIQGNPGYRPQGVANQMRPPEKIKRMNDVSQKDMQNQIDMGKNKLRNEMKTSIQTSLSNKTNEIKNMMASLLQMNTASTSGGLVTEGPTVPNPPKSVNPEEDECVEETYTDPDLAEYTIKVPPPLVQKPKPSIQRYFVLHTRDSPPPHILYPSRMLKQKQQEKDDIRIQKFGTFILKKLPEKLEDPGKFLISYGFSELKCKALADLGASINLMPLSAWKKLGLPDLIPTRMTLELANRAICTPDGIARDVFVPVGKFTFPVDFVVVDYESDPRVPLILGRPFLRTARALIDVHGEEMILRDRDERLTLNMKHDTANYSNHPHRESVNLINIFNISSEDCLEELLAIDSFNNIHPHFDDDPLSGSTTYSANSLLEEFTDELDLITYPPDYDDNRTCDIESNIREIEFLLYQGEDSDFKDSIDQSNLTNYDDLFVDPIPEMFTDEQPLDYSFPSRFDVYPDDFLEIKSNADSFDDDSFDSKGEKIKEAKLLIDQLDLPCDILSEYDSFNSHNFSRDDVLPSLDNEDKNFSRDDVLPSLDNEDKVFNPGILIHEKLVKIITRFAQEKKLAVSFASLLFEDFDPPFYELLVFKEVPNSMRLLLFSSENEENVFKPGIYTSKKVHFCFLSELSHPGYHVFKVNLIFLSLMKIFHVQSGKNTPLLDVLLFHFYPP